MAGSENLVSIILSEEAGSSWMLAGIGGSVCWFDMQEISTVK